MLNGQRLNVHKYSHNVHVLVIYHNLILQYTVHVGESQLESSENLSDEEDNAIDADEDLIDRWPDSNAGYGLSLACSTGPQSNARTTDPRNQSSIAQSTIHDRGRLPAHIDTSDTGTGTGTENFGGSSSRYTSSSGISARTAGTRRTNKSLPGALMPSPMRFAYRAPATQPASFGIMHSRQASSDKDKISISLSRVC